MTTQNILELRNISKIYPGVNALSNITMSFKKGEIHALLGENGAGKSTLIKVLSGAIIPNAGDIIIDGKVYSSMNPSLAREHGISVIYQEFNLIPAMDVTENIYIGNEIRRGSLIDKQKMVEKAREQLDALGINIDPLAKIRELSVAYQQIVEIAKAVSQNVRILIMDEPSAPLTKSEVQMMFQLVLKLKSQGATIIYISHRLEEIFEISDRVTVMRDGQYVAMLNTSETSQEELIKLMIGRTLSDHFPVRSITIGTPALEIKNLCINEEINDISLKVHKGEILGLFGLVGAGRTETVRAIFGADSLQSGEIFIFGKPVRISKPSDAIKHGIALIPEDRKRQGIILKMSVGHNITLASIKSISKMTVINNKKENSIVKDYIQRLKIKTPSDLQTVQNLSGGNQQKVALAKWLATNAKIIIFDEPTRGVDVGAKYEIYQLMNELVNNGIAIIMISSDMPELIGMSDRIVVMHEGKITGELTKEEVTQEKIMWLASGNHIKEAN